MNLKRKVIQMKLSKTKLNELICECYASERAEYFGVSFDAPVYDEVTHESDTGSFQFDAVDILQTLLTFWGEWFFVHTTTDSPPYNIFLPSNVDVSPAEQFAYAFYSYCNGNLVNLVRIVTAYISNYNPLQNYGAVETELSSYDADNPETETKEISGKVKTNARVKGYNANGGDITVTEAGSTYSTDITNMDGEGGRGQWNPTVTHRSTAYDSTTMKDVEQQHQSMSAGTTMTQADAANNFTEWDDYKETTTRSGGRGRELNRAGNIGVTTSQQMIEAELKLRKHDILKEWLGEFVAEYCVLSPDNVMDIEGM